MGNARWKGVRLKDVLAKAGIAKDAVEVAFDGADSGALEATPDFVKSIPAWKAMDENTLIAWQMNGEPLPHWNGAPARIVVPGWTATYWMKQVVSIRALAQPLTDFWMAKAYRIPKGKFSTVDRFTTPGDGREHADHRDRGELADHQRTEGQQVKAGAPLVVKGIAWDAGYGIRSVDVSVDGGRSWQSAELGADQRALLVPAVAVRVQAAKGRHVVSARAANGVGATQVNQLIFNPAGYNNNVSSASASRPSEGAR